MWPRTRERNGRSRPGLIDTLERVLEGGISLPYEGRGVPHGLREDGERVVVTSMRVHSSGRDPEGPGERAGEDGAAEP